MSRPPRRIAAAAALGVALGPAAGLDLQGHRGARGLLPENTLPGFARALAVGVTTLEMDLGVSADGVVVVSHDARLNPEITRGPGGAWLAAPGPALRALSLVELRRYDVGRIRPGTAYARRFPRQQPCDGARIPTLAEVVELTRRAGNSRVRFNVETKLSPHAPDLTLPPEGFAEAVVGALREAGVAGRATVQSFDWRTLQRVQRIAPEIETVYLSAAWLDDLGRGTGGSAWTAGLDVDDYGGSIPRLVKAAGGAVWSPDHRDLEPAALAEARALGLRVIVWTVNDPARMQRLIELGVDGIITDYPDRLRRILERLDRELPPATPVPAEHAAGRAASGAGTRGAAPCGPGDV